MTDSPRVFRPSREHVIAIALMTGIALIGIAWAPLILGWFLILPAAYLIWVFTTSTTIDERGIGVKYAVRPNAFIGWDKLRGIAFTGARAKATTNEGDTYPLPGVTFNSIPELAEASRGRITDVITASEEYADGKYEIIDRQGRTVLLNREEYDAYLATHPTIPGPRPETTAKEQQQ